MFMVVSLKNYVRGLSCLRYLGKSPCPPKAVSVGQRLIPIVGKRLLQTTPSLSATEFAMCKRLIFDVDCGVDDAQALMIALANPDVKVEAITCVQGNTTVDNVVKNVLRVLKVCEKLEIPVFKGADKPILGECIDAGHFHGVDGLGDVPDPDAPGMEFAQEEGAVSAIIRLINANPGQITLVATAPLTNLALAVRLDPSIPSKLKGLFIMGGNTESRGNTTVCAEYNFAADPEAAYTVLNEYLCPTTIACWEFTCKSCLSWEFCDAWLSQDSDKARFMKKIFAYSLETARKTDPGLVSCDSYAMAAAIDDSVVLESDHYPVTVELTGTYTRGMMVVDTTGMLKKTHKVWVMKKMDLDRFMGMMMDSLK